MENNVRLPGYTDRVAVIGRTGSGKTQFGTWLLGRMPFDRMPYVMLDFKGDDLIGSIDRAREIGLNEVPKQPGLYVVRPMMNEAEAVENWLWKLYERENVGLYIDEGYAVPKGSDAFTAILTRGRSKRIPCICLTQRPSWISRFVFSEANYYTVFHLNDKRDQQTVQAFLPKDRASIDQRLPEYHSYYYDVGRDDAVIMGPVPKADVIVDDINSRLQPKRRKI